jgi:hypothetical protein
MGFSMFSKPLGLGRMNAYNYGGTAIGAGVGAALADRDHRTSGAVVGAAAGNLAGIGMSAYHAYGHNAPDVIDNIGRGIKGAMGSGMSAGARMNSLTSWGRIAATKAGRNPNVDAAVTGEVTKVANGVRNLMSKFRG